MIEYDYHHDSLFFAQFLISYHGLSCFWLFVAFTIFPSRETGKQTLLLYLTLFVLLLDRTLLKNVYH